MQLTNCPLLCHTSDTLSFDTTSHTSANTHRHTSTHSLSDLQEDSRVPVVQVDQLQIGDGIDHPHGTASDGQGDEQRRNVTTQRDDREHERDDEGGGEES